jgi:hypothetical protein
MDASARCPQMRSGIASSAGESQIAIVTDCAELQASASASVT